jgi:hypothetical protein
MNKFYEGDLIKDFKMNFIHEDGDGFPVFEVENQDVRVVLVFSWQDDNVLWLSEFYNYSNIKGKARCTLYFMLKQMINHNYINENTSIDIPDIMPNTKKNAKMYFDMGFNIRITKRGNYVSKPPYQTIGQFIRKLERWCNNDEKTDSNKRQKTSFGKQKYRYNGRNYVIHVGPRGGKYIIVKNVKKYI